MTDKTHNMLSWLTGIIFFILCFVAVMNGYEVLMVNLLLIGSGLAMGYSLGMFIRGRQRGGS